MCLYYRAKRGLEIPSLGREITPFTEIGIVRDKRMFQVKTFFRAEVVLAQSAVRAFSSSGIGISPPFCCSATYLFVQVADSFRFSENCACRHAPTARRERSSRDANGRRETGMTASVDAIFASGQGPERSRTHRLKV